MHVGNCTDGPADYQLSGDGTVDPPAGESALQNTWTLDPHRENYWDFAGSARVVFEVKGNTYPVDRVGENAIALLVQSGNTLHAIRVQRQKLEESTS